MCPWRARDEDVTAFILRGMRYNDALEIANTGEQPKLRSVTHIYWARPSEIGGEAPHLVTESVAHVLTPTIFSFCGDRVRSPSVAWRAWFELCASS